MKNIDRDGRSPLHHVAVDVVPGEHGATVRRLIAEGCDPNTRDKRGWTPLHAAAEHFALELASELLAAGAQVDVMDEHGNTPLNRAVFTSRGRGEMIALLREHGADPRVKNKHGVSPVTLARTIANYDVQRFFADVSGEE